VRITSTQPFPRKEEFDWLVKYEIVSKGKVVQDGYLKEQTRTYNGKDFKNVTAVGFKSFGVLRRWPGEVTLRLSVEKADQSSERYENQFQINVGVSNYI